MMAVSGEGTAHTSPAALRFRSQPAFRVIINLVCGLLTVDAKMLRLLTKKFFLSRRLSWRALVAPRGALTSPMGDGWAGGEAATRMAPLFSGCNSRCT